jgi:predicted TIM-barrel fold metal-dependent hydrolase
MREGRLFFGCEPDEPDLAEVASKLGDGCLLYSSDYPHGNAKWPNTVRMIRETAGLSEEAKEKILGRNAVRFYGLGTR